jgi:cell division protein FtsZ
MTNAGSALMGIGYASGEGRALNAARAAIASPLLEASIEGARGILLNISGGSDLGLFEVNEAAEIIHEVAHPDANIIAGMVIDDAMGDEVRVTVIAAGASRSRSRPSSQRSKPAAKPSAGGGRGPVLGLGGRREREREREPEPRGDIFGSADDDLGLGSDDDDDDFDVPSFLK